jgi:hypothetical protein
MALFLTPYTALIRERHKKVCLDICAGFAGSMPVVRELREARGVSQPVPALKSLWSASDDYYERRRRYSRAQFTSMFRAACLAIEKAAYWGFPIVLAYDTLFLLPMNKRRARRNVTDDAALQSVAKADRSRLLVNAVRAVFALDALIAGLPFGPWLLVVARKR